MGDRDVTRPRLMHLKDADDLQVAEGEPDIRGWDLRTMDGQRIGTVEDLVIDTEVMRVRYIEGKLELAEGGTDTERSVLIPIADARLDEDEDDVLVDYSSLAARQMPTHDRQSLPLLPEQDRDAIDQTPAFWGRAAVDENAPATSALRVIRSIAGRSCCNGSLLPLLVGQRRRRRNPDGAACRPRGRDRRHHHHHQQPE